MGMVSRRQWLQGAAALVAAPFVLRPARFGAWAAETPSLPIPPLEEGRMVGGVRVFDLAIRTGTHDFGAGRRGTAIGINADYGGPTLRMRAGETVQLNVSNRLGETTTLHWHGFHLPAAADGGPHKRIAPGAVWQPRFPVKQKAGLFWYHSHLKGYTGRQVYFGQAGTILVEDEDEARLPLPREYGVDDIPLVLQDRVFDAAGQPVYDLTPMTIATGYIGDVPVVNGAIQPHFIARRRWLRLRLLNSSNASIYRLSFSDRRRFFVIGSDGGLLPRAYRARRLILAPGERAQILVEVRPGRPFRLEGEVLSPMMGMRRRRRARAMRRLRFLDILPAPVVESGPRPPRRLIRLPAPQPARAVRTRRFVLEMGMGGPMMRHRSRRRGRMGGGMMGGNGPTGGNGAMGGGSADGGGMGGAMGGGGMGMRFTINGKTMDMARIDEVVRLGTDEIWEVINRSPMPHPFHVHDVQFRILDRNGRRPRGLERGLKDTVLVWPRERVRLLLSFRDYADPELPYMYHCHTLEHEDAGMMGQFVVVD